MNPSVTKIPALMADMAEKPRVRSTASGSLVLRPTQDGWALLGPDGEVVFHGHGVAGRHQCLEFAHDHGAISVVS